MNEQQLALIRRLAKSQDGHDFLNEVLKVMYQETYQDILISGKEFRDELVGFGNALKTLVDLFEKSVITPIEEPINDTEVGFD